MEIKMAEGEVTNDKGVKYYFHTGGAERPYLNYFSKNEAGKVPIPENLEVFLNPRNGLPMVRRKK